jgi:outer membrane protein assembly factor BamB
LGGGYSAPSIADGKIFGMSSRGEQQVAWALSEKDGSNLWVTPIGPTVSQRMQQGIEGPGCTPAVDGDRVYVESMGGDLACLNASDGKVIWHHNLVRDYGGRPPGWSYRESPLVDGDKLICSPGARDAGIVALDKLTGKTIWKSAIPGSSGAAYCSPIAFDFEGQREYVNFTANMLVGISASDGKFLWHFDKPANRNSINITTPIYHDGYVFASSAYGAGAGLVKLSKESNGGVKADEVYFTHDLQNHHGGVILLDGAVYGANGGNNGGFLACIDFMTGKTLWDQRDGTRQAAKGAIAYADGRLYYRTETGAMLLLEPSPKQYIERGRFQEPNRSRSPDWSHPVIANGKLYLRDQDVLMCYDIKMK